MKKLPMFMVNLLKQHQMQQAVVDTWDGVFKESEKQCDGSEGAKKSRKKKK